MVIDLTPHKLKLELPVVVIARYLRELMPTVPRLQIEKFQIARILIFERLRKNKGSRSQILIFHSILKQSKQIIIFKFDALI